MARRVAWNCAPASNTCAPSKAAALSAHWRMKGSTLSVARARAGAYRRASACARNGHAVEHLAREKGAHGLDDGAGLLEQARGRFNGGAYLGVGGQAAAGVQQQAQAQAAQALQAGRQRLLIVSCAGRLMLSRASGLLSTCIISAASCTVRHRAGGAATV